MTPLSRALLLALVVLTTTCATVRADTPPINVTYPENPPAGHADVVNDNFLGISFELSSFDTLWGKTNTTLPNAMQNYLANIRARLTSNLRIRVGGNGMDASTYVPDQTNMITLTDPNAYFNNIPVNLGPSFFDVMNAMADAVGEMQFIIGLSMQDPSDDSNVVELATAAVQKMGGRLDAMLLGNEPDLYANHGQRKNYTITDYIPEIAHVLDDLRNSPAGNLIQNPLIGGPTTCCNWDLDDVISAGLGNDDYKYYSIQHYPNNYCNGPDSQNTNISYYLSHTNVPYYAQWNIEGIDMAQKQGTPVLVTEYNSVSCGGSPNISPAFAASLWAIDAGLQFASSNVSAAYLHTREFGVTYNLFDPPTPETSTESGWRTGSTYYAALLLSETMSPNGSVVVDLNLDNSIYDPASKVAGYAVYDNGGTTRGKLVLINYSNGTSQDFTIPANMTHAFGIRTLVAPTVDEQTNISWAGQTVGANGDLEGPQTTDYLHCKNGCTVAVPGPGVVLMYLNPNASDSDSFYTGNSTVAGTTGYDSSNADPVLGPSLLWIYGVLGMIGLLFWA